MPLVSLNELDARLRKRVRAWDPALARSFRRYFPAWPRILARPRGAAEPYWILVPHGIVARHLGRRVSSRRFLEDVLFGQSCALLAVKIHDDLFDGHCDDRSLIFAADHLLLAAHEAFSFHFPRHSPFWSYCASAISRTLNAIVAVDECQVHGYRSPGSVAAMIREGYAVCNIGTYAACLRARIAPQFERIARCTDELAFVGKMLDDLEDMQEDRKRGRINLAAYLVMGSSAGSRKKSIQKFAKSVLLNGSVDRWYAMLQRHLRRAATEAAASGIPELTHHVVTHQKAVASSEGLLHQKRVQLVFGGLQRRPR